MQTILSKFKTINLQNFKNEISTNKGVYIWINKQDEIVYVGIACGKKGLYHRICNQHLNPNYLEFRDSKHNSKDEYQLSHAIIKLRSKNILKKGIDKSSFRKSIGRKLRLRPGEDTCNYIFTNLQLKLLELNNIEAIKKLEIELISKFNPIFNTSYKI